jgi:L-amino acid N-acyltransferase YncA
MTAEAPIIRPAGVADLGAIERIYAHYVTATTATFELEPPAAAAWRDRFALVGDAGLPFLVAELPAGELPAGVLPAGSLRAGQSRAAVPVVSDLHTRPVPGAGDLPPVQVGNKGAELAPEGGGVVGYAYCSPWKPRPAYRQTVEDSIYVAPWAGRRGAGGLLLAALLDGCAAAGVREVIAVIADSGDPASVQLHSRHGFQPAGRLTRVGFKHGSWLDTVLMQRSLG